MNPKLKRVLSAALNPLSLAVGAAGGATFALSGLWWVLPLTGAAWGVLSATQFRGATVEGLPPRYAARLRILHSLIARIDGALSSANDTVRACLSDVPPTLIEMKTRIADLLARQARIDAYLAEVHPQVAHADLGRLEAALAAARNEETRARWATAVENKRAEIDARSQLLDGSERIAAELAAIESALETTLSKIVALEHVRGDVAAEAQAGITAELSDVLLKVSALEQALDETSQQVSHTR